MEGNVGTKSRQGRLAAAGEGLLFLGAVGAVGVGAITHYPGSSQHAEEGPPAPFLSRELPPPTTYFVVVPEQRAEELQSGIDEGNNVRHSAGLDPMRESVLRAVDAQHAQELVRAIEEGNKILAAFGTEDRAVLLDG